MTLLNAGQKFTATIPLDGIIHVDLSVITDPTDVFHVEIVSGGAGTVLRGFFLTEDGTNPLEPGNTSRFTVFSFGAPISAGTPEAIVVAHMDPNVPAGQRIFCTGIRANAIVDERRPYCTFEWLPAGGGGQWVINAPVWTAAP